MRLPSRHPSESHFATYIIALRYLLHVIPGRVGQEGLQPEESQNATFSTPSVAFSIQSQNATFSTPSVAFSIQSQNATSPRGGHGVAKCDLKHRHATLQFSRKMRLHRWGSYRVAKCDPEQTAPLSWMALNSKAVSIGVAWPEVAFCDYPVAAEG